MQEQIQSLSIESRQTVIPGCRQAWPDGRHLAAAARICRRRRCGLGPELWGAAKTTYHRFKRRRYPHLREPSGEICRSIAVERPKHCARTDQRYDLDVDESELKGRIEIAHRSDVQVDKCGRVFNGPTSLILTMARLSLLSTSA